MKSLRTTAVVGSLLAATLLTACAPLLIGSAVVGGSLMATDRRTSGAQIEDQAIEMKARNRWREVLGEQRYHESNVSTTSYNRIALITGEVPTEADKAAMEQAVARIDNVRGVVNELAVMPLNPAGNRSNDLLVSSKVKATLIDDRSLQANAFKVTTERGIVYLMGRVTEAEASRAVELTRTISGVNKVVRVLDIITEAELAELQPKRTADGPPRAPGRN
jgi:osmotically-inducible protein OsmY